MHNYNLDLISETILNHYASSSKSERWFAVDSLLQAGQSQPYTLPLSQSDLDFSGEYYMTHDNLDSIWLEYSSNSYIGGRVNVLQDIVQLYDGSNVCYVIDEIKLFEEEELILARSQTDIRQILEAASVARFSLAYWDSNYSTYLEYPGPGQSSVSREVPWRKIIRIALADAGGALAGSPLGTAGSIILGATASWNEFENQFPERPAPGP